MALILSALGGCKDGAGPEDGDAGVASARQCGNGALDPGELCDPAIAAGREGACPTKCESDDPCTPRVLAGAQCQVECVGVLVVKAISGDGCCPAGVGPAEDADCGACGDGVIGPDETCEMGSCVTSDQCTAPGACLNAVFTGDPNTCNSSCQLSVREQCRSGDGCCPSACSTSTDTDCSATCGNGTLEDGETCEPGSTSTPCPTGCDDGVACTSDVLTGSAANCNVTCAHIEITAPTSGDGCCPTGANAASDSDCTPVCGNQVREPGEQCDPCPASCEDDDDACTTDQASGTGVHCDLVCSHTAIESPIDGDACCPRGANTTNDSDCQPVCGNEVVESGEMCDGGDGCSDDCTMQSN